MADINRLQCTWTGLVGGSGVTTFYMEDITTAVTRVSAFFEAIKYLLPSSVSVTIPNNGEIIESTTGGLLGTWSSGSQVVKVGTGANSQFSAASGACITWNTSTVVGRRFLRGRTYLVPFTALAYDNGTLLDTTLTALNTAAANLSTGATPFYVWHRPTTTGGTDGRSAAITSHRVRDKVAILTSRRD